MNEQILVDKEFLECMRNNLYDINRSIHDGRYADASFRLGRYYETIHDLLDDEEEDEEEDNG
jgi:hypothetical protein